MVGGYQIIDFGGKTLSSTSQTIAGIHRKCSSGKPIIVRNFKVSTTLYSGSYIAQRVAGSSGAWNLYVPNTKSSNSTYYTIVVTTADGVTIS